MERGSKSAWAPLVDEATGKAYCGHVQTRYATRPNRRFSFFLWSGLYWAGKLLTWPAEKTVETYLYIFNRDIKPGRYEQWSTVRGEKIHRALLLVVMVLLGTIAVLLFPFVTLRTQNLGFLPHLSSANNLANPTKRVKYLLQELQLGRDDVLCFQECFDLAATKAIIRGLNREPKQGLSSGPRLARHDSAGEAQDMLRRSHPSDEDDLEGGPTVLKKEKPIYPWIVADCDPRSYRLNSGQVIASRYPLANPEFVRYTDRVGEDKMAGKGVLGCTVILGTTADGRSLKLTIFTTHLQAGSAPPKDTIHLQQIRTAAKFVRYYNHKHIDERQDVWVGAVLMGDFNIAPLNGDPEWWGSGKLTWDREWAAMNQAFHAHHMKNLFYEDTEDGEVRTRNRDLFLRFQDVFADRLRTLVDEIKEVRASAAGADQDGEAQAGTRLRIDAIGLTNRITAWLGRREEARSARARARAAAASDQQRKGKGKKKKEKKKEGKKKRVKQAEVLVQTSDIEVVDDDDEDEGGDRDGDDSDSDDGEAEVAELRDMLTRELVRQARAVTGWRRTDQWFAEERPHQHREGAADEAEAEAQPLEAMVELLRQLRAIPSDPVVELFAHERRLALLRRAEGGHDQERGKWGRPKLRCDPRVEYVIPGTSIDKDHYEGKFPDEVDFNDIDHVWSLERFRGAEPRMERVRTRLVEYHPFFYTDHLGKRLEFQVVLQD
ncbi:uncharacterized protein ACA1_116170 [Acanthamoeba castellanii str. Neff]|uniref:Endonuclease/exonuclease/phosphatase domain-containing protein n=1 Tax=Acanthamoeba castellanii (strain ATCC 30010 / Neff) TaxID=1257118 RepID=L8H6T2_ACACF|nr:uncharacterized protein ACA1_116170 [Acanthamoeba castellanii str. Neff]ELR20156.1 hypothetical protein ACA1_116170 [Acanthamoeba castellanii str. Neff]